jgi:hypothetical protein
MKKPNKPRDPSSKLLEALRKSNASGRHTTKWKAERRQNKITLRKEYK